jgi:hypothetical protein
VKNDPDNCRLGIDGSHVFNDTPPKPWGVAYDLETIDTAEVMTLQEGQDLSVAHGLDGPAKLSDGYVIVIDDMPWPFPLSFSNKDTAIRAAQLLRRAGEICRSKPVRLNAVGGPGLSETLLFIQQKLKDEASVVYENQSPGNKNPVSVSSRVANAEADPTSCQIRYKDFEITYDVQGNPRTPREYNFHLLFRYVRKLEVVDYQTFAARLGGPIISAVTPNVYCLIVTGDGEYDFYFRDAEMADRVAKAMNHAAELCGSNKSKETKEPSRRWREMAPLGAILRLYRVKGIEPRYPGPEARWERHLERKAELHARSKWVHDSSEPAHHGIEPGGCDPGLAESAELTAAEGARAGTRAESRARASARGATRTPTGS